MKIGKRALASEILPEDVKKEISDLGIDYVPRGRKFTDPEAEEITRMFDSEEGGLDKLEGAICIRFRFQFNKFHSQKIQ